MSSNAEMITFVIEYIEDHLSENLSLDELARMSGYSKYHLHRMFTGIVKLSVHNYIQRRRLTEAAKQLLFTQLPILDIALGAGYESQQSFTVAFKELYKKSPLAFRNKHEFHPIQLKFTMEGILSNLRGDRIMEIEIKTHGPIHLIGYKENTKRGFHVIAKCWHKLHKTKNKIPDRLDMEFLVGLNDYSENFSMQENHPAFDYYAAAEVSSIDKVPSKMQVRTLPLSKYVVFTFQGKAQDSLQPVVEYIYKVWFPQSTSRLNENARYDFARYGEIVDEKGQSHIEVWIPIL